MKTAAQIKNILHSQLPSLAKRYPIGRLALFGSVSRNEHTTKSDVDILVEFTKPVGFQFFELARELEFYLDLPVDLVSRNGIKPAYFKEIEPDLIDV